MPPILPPEILGIIFANVDDRKTLCNILITSREFSQLVEPVLYARIDFPPSLVSSKLMRLKSLLEALETSNGRRASYVQALSFAAIASRTGEHVLIDKILAKTINLKSLKMHASYSTSFEGHFFHRSPTYTLTILHLGSTSLQHDKGLLDFLESHPSLESLHLRVRSPQLENHIFSSTSFPNLTVLLVHSSLVRAFLCTSAPLTCLRVSGPVHWPDPGSTNEVCTKSVRTLSCLLNADVAVISAASLFPNLEWLSGPINTASLEDLYAQNRKLRGICFTGAPYQSGFSPDEITRHFGTIPTLQFMEYHGRGYE